MLGSAWKSWVRVNSFTGKELREVMRRPGVLASLILGPFLIMLVFGFGYRGAPDAFATEIVVPEGSALPQDPAFYEDLAPGRLEVVRVSQSREESEDRLRRNLIDLVVVAPTDAESDLRAGRQTTIEVVWNQIDPVRMSWAQLAVSTMVSTLNAEIIRLAAAEGISIAASELGPMVENISAEVIAEPTRAETVNVAPSEPAVVSFFGPAVLALILQHISITMAALSMVRERLSGQIDLFRVAPVDAAEVLIGKYIAYALLSLLISVPVGALLVFGLGVPMLSSVVTLLGIVFLITVASLGLGLLISLVADSERQAVQLSMLVLLASIFLSGFVLPVRDFVLPVQLLAYALPVTHGIAVLQESMLRGSIFSVWMLAALAGIALVLYALSLQRLGRILRPVA
jgi:ABC-2 type transport system permease protein